MSKKNKLNLEERILRNSKTQKKHNSLLMIFVTVIAIGLLVFFMLTTKTEEVNVFGKEDKGLHLTYLGNITLNENIRQNDLKNMFSAVSGIIKESDYATASLNVNNFAKDPKRNIDKNLKNIGFLNHLGLSTINLTNNSVDLEQIKQITRQADAKHGYNFTTGNGSNPLNSKITNKTVHGKKVASVSFTDVSSKYMDPRKATTSIALEPKIFMPLVQRLKKDNDVVIVNVDWGIPDEPNVTNRQKQYGRALVDAGADVVVGHNTVVQKIENYKGSSIFYSLGNVTSDKFLSENKKGIAVQHTMNGDKNKFQITPIRTTGDQVTKDNMNAIEKQKFFNRISSPSVNLKETNGGYTYEN